LERREFMKLCKINDVKKISLALFFSLAILLSTLKVIIPQVYAQPEVFVDPIANVANPGESFTLDVNISSAVDLYSYEAKVGFDKNVLEAVGVEEGPFLSEGTTSPLGTFFSYELNDPEFAYAACAIIMSPPRVGVDGSGRLFNITFNVKAPGESSLTLYDTQLYDRNGDPMTHSTSDGTFSTTVPVAIFSYTPKSYGRPIVGENVTFDASASYDPDGGTIVDYAWDFNDTTSGTGMIVNHTFNEPSGSGPLVPYNVTLTVTDDDDETTVFFIWETEQAVNVKLHDVSVLKVETPAQVLAGEKAEIDVTVLNNGSHFDTCNVTAYYNSKPIKTEYVEGLGPGENETITFIWNTFINQTIMSPNSTSAGTWTGPLNASESNDEYTNSSIDGSYQEYFGYLFDTVGWTSVSKVEVGVEVKTDPAGDDQLNLSIYNGRSWSDDLTYDITFTSDTFFWVDLTDSLEWMPSLMNRTRVRIEYIQVGGAATPIYIDWLPVRISPLVPSVIEPDSYNIWANAYLVNQWTQKHEFRPGEDANLTNNILFGNPIKVTIIPQPDMAVGEVEVDPTEVIFGLTATVTVQVENLGNTRETYDVFMYANSTKIGNQTGLQLSAGATAEVSFSWFEATNTTEEGIYNVTVICGIYNATSGFVEPILGETDTANNRQNVTVLMRLLPRPLFSVSPETPEIGEQVAFDASASYAPGEPGGTITEYVWDFGDGSSGTGATTTHAYDQPGTYSVRLTVVDDEDLNHTQGEPVVVPKLDSSITISSSALVVPISLDTTISGAISPVRADVTVTINYTRVDEIAWMTLTDTSTDSNGQYSHVWEPTEAGDYQLKAFWGGDSSTLSAETAVLNVTVTIQDTAIAEVDLSRIRVTVGDSVTISVVAANKGTATETFNVGVYYNETLLETKTVDSLVAEASETLSFNWDTQDLEEGVYMVKAEAEPLLGETYLEDNARISVVVVEVGGAPLDTFLYTTIGLAIVVAALAIYLVKIMRSKP
jgi:hypothetical protein